MAAKQLSERLKAELRKDALWFIFQRKEEGKKGKRVVKQEVVTLTLAEAYSLFGLLYDNIDRLADKHQDQQHRQG